MGKTIRFMVKVRQEKAIEQKLGWITMKFNKTKLGDFALPLNMAKNALHEIASSHASECYSVVLSWKEDRFSCGCGFELELDPEI